MSEPTDAERVQRLETMARVDAAQVAFLRSTIRILEAQVERLERDNAALRSLVAQGEQECE